MPWIKRNLFFVIGGGAALLLLGFAGFYLFKNLQNDSAITEELNQQISELRRMYDAPVHPGTDTVDNISAAKKDQQRIREFLTEARKLFVPIPPYQKTDDQGFNNLLLNTIYQLQVGASNAGVVLPPQYAFTFSAQAGKLAFAAGSIEPWTAQLSEIQTICQILYQARVNALEGLRRVPVSPDDVAAAGTADYLPAALTTNDIAIVAPYEVSFRSFSAELGAVMEGILRSTNCLVVKTLNVEPSKVVAGADPNVLGGFNPGYPGLVNPGFSRGVDSRYGGAESRYGGFGQPAPGVARPLAPTVPTIFQSEQPLRVTLLIDVVKLKPPQ